MKAEANTLSPVKTGTRFSLTLLCVLLGLATLLVYLPVRHHEFVAYDDADYVTDNRMVQSGLSWAGVKWAFTTGHAGNWHPLTWLSHMLDAQLFGNSPAGPHLVNVLLHVANTILLLVLLQRLTGALWRSAFVAALFALHPLHVESVAWVAERKDVLSAFFGLGALLAYRSYATHETYGTYILCLALFTLGLMSKPMLVTLPFVFLLLDYWPLQSTPTTPTSRFTFHVSRLTPFFLLSIASCVITFVVQRRGGAVQSLAHFSLSERMGNALVSYARYLGKIFWPMDLATSYPHPGHWPVGKIILAAALVAGLCLGALWCGRRFPFVTTGWFWFFGMLIPTIGLVQVGEQSMADRYTYLPSIGIFIVLAWGAGEIVKRWRLPKVAVGLGTVLPILLCALQTGVQLHHWQNSETLFSHALALTQKNSLAHNNLGNALLEKGQLEDAIVEFHKALEIHPDYAEAHVNLGNALLQQNRSDEALSEFQAALKIRPNFAEAHYNSANAMLARRQVDEAIVEFQAALKIQPDYLMARNNLGNTLLQKGQLDEAIVQYRKALELRPDFVVTRHNLGMALFQSGHADEAVGHFRKIVELQPDSANACNNLGWILRRSGRLDEAIPHLLRALEIRPDYAGAHANLGRVFLEKGKAPEAVAHFRAVLKTEPNDADIQSLLAWVLATWPEASVRNGSEAIELARRANQSTGGQDPAILQTLAAAYAEGGRFADAVATAERAVQLAESKSDGALAQSLRSQLVLYQAGSPFREVVPTSQYTR